MDRLLGALGDLTNQLLHALGRLDVIDMNGIHALGKEIANRAVNEVGFKNQCAGCGLLGHSLLHFAPLIEQEAEISDKEAGLLSLARRANDNAHSLGESQLGQDLAETRAFLGILDLAGDTTLVIEGHEDHVTAGHGDVGRDPRPLGADRPLGHLNHNLASDGINVGNVLGGDLLFLFRVIASTGTLNGLDAAIKSGRDGVPEVEKGILLEADIDEHGLEAVLDVADLALEDAADNIALAVALDGVFLQLAVLQEGYAFFEFLAADDQLDTGA